MKTFYTLAIISFLSVHLMAQNQETPPVTLDRISNNLFQILGGRGANGGMFIRVIFIRINHRCSLRS